MRICAVRCCLVILSMLCSMPLLLARHAIFEFKAAYFLPTDCAFKAIYQHGSALYGPELTVQVCEDTDLYAFVSVDYFQKCGRSVGLSEPTEVKLIPVAVGAKYLISPWCDYLDLYVGLGFEAVNVRTTNCSASVITKLSQWALGGIAKVGSYWYLPHDFVIDLFVDYSFAKTGNNCLCPNATILQPVRADVSGAIFGVGVGYRF